MNLRCFFGHRWAVSTSRMRVLVQVYPAADTYDCKVDGVEERWVVWEYCLSCGITRNIETEARQQEALLVD